MATPIAYPRSLPGPQTATIQSAERRALSDLPGPRAARALQRDRLATQRCSFYFTHAQAEVFDNWYRNNLVEGGAWFAAGWPLPQGGIGVRRFLGAPAWGEYQPGYGWPVSALFEVRGRGLLPMHPSGPIIWGPLSMAPPWVLDGKLATLDFGDSGPNDHGDPRQIWSNRPAGFAGKVYFEVANVDTSFSSTPGGPAGFANAFDRAKFWCVDDGGALTDAHGEVLYVPLPGDNPGLVPGSSALGWASNTTRWAVDLDAGEAWYGVGDQWLGRDPDTGLHPTFTGVEGPILILGDNRYSLPRSATTLHTAAAEMEQTIPAGFVALEDA